MLGIIILNYNQYQKTIDCINTIFETTKSEYIIYLIDNDSPNNSYEELYKLYNNHEKVKLVKTEKNLGYANGNNIGIKMALADGCDYVLISNNDLLYKENAIDTMLNEIKEKNAFIVSPYIENIDGSIQTSAKINKPSFKEYMLFSTYLSNLVSKAKTNEFFKKSYPTKPCEIYWASGACFMANMKDFEKIGFFDSYTFLYYEEYIISEKAKKQNLKLYFVPSAKVIHYHGASTGGSANIVTRLANFKSETYFFKNYWKASKLQLKQIQIIRCLEVLFTFTKEKKFKDALKFVKQTKIILKETPCNED